MNGALIRTAIFTDVCQCSSKGANILRMRNCISNSSCKLFQRETSAICLKFLVTTSFILHNILASMSLFLGHVFECWYACKCHGDGTLRTLLGLVHQVPQHRASNLRAVWMSNMNIDPVKHRPMFVDLESVERVEWSG